MLNKLDETRILKKIPEAQMQDLYLYLIHILEKETTHLILLVGTRDAVQSTYQMIVNDLLTWRHSFVRDWSKSDNVIHLNNHPVNPILCYILSLIGDKIDVLRVVWLKLPSWRYNTISILRLISYVLMK